ncbi:signal transduction histidine kinase/ligand-binding sensor domain-containing protein [Lysobacter niabensis]|uniref:Signal transduction histidine kinase/ligand-binding sensor domain-containing protein n=1 Tax=Agrilutibacter niabensis TaxID=380628 RepID=A0ABU1VNA8_9GAMM|nr:two-component regulator propeller domain-containing protein [Lysobacter niabensis]MDR7098964.1 signal transduction histidine kinase/ligand-binding sensor domain-containing protein [Lysobacter niabensis]
MSSWSRKSSLGYFLLMMLLLAALPYRVAAQQASVVFGRYKVDTWRSHEEVKLVFTSNLVQTRDGYLWLSSQSGLVRFDGVRFKAFTADNSPALRGRTRLITIPLAQDREGGLWVGSGSGLFRVVGDQVDLIATNESFKADIINAAAVDPEDRLWAVTRSGRVFVIDRGGHQRELRGTLVSYSGSSMTVDNNGDIWIAAGEGAVYRIHGGHLTRIGLPKGADVRDPSRVYATRDGSIWFGTQTAIARWKDGQIQHFPLPVTKGFGAVTAMAEDAKGTLWVGSYGAGLHWFDGKQFRSFTRADGLSDDRVIDILPDQQGNMWVATRDGLNRFRPLQVEAFTARTGLPSDMPGGMLRDAGGGVWLAPPTGGLFYGHIDTAGSTFQRVGESPAELVLSLAPARQGGVWVGRPNGVVSRFAAGQAAAEPSYEGLPPVTDLLEDPAGTLWIATWRGLFRGRDGRLERVKQKDDFIFRLFKDSSGAVWIASLTGVTRIGSTGDETFIRWPTQQQTGIRPNVLFEAPKGTVWVGSDEGLVRVSGGRTRIVAMKDGLPESWVGAGEVDNAGRLWLGQLGGLTRIRLAELTAVADGKLAGLVDVGSFKPLDGLPGGDPAAWPHPWSFQEPSGKLWFAMGHGIVSVNPATARPVGAAPKVYIDEVAADGVRNSDLHKLIIEPATRRIDIRYTGVDLSHGPDVRFRYRLDGFDPDWIDAGTQRVASYTRLAPGTYRFRVSARDVRGQWSPQESDITLQVLAPFYLKAWFIALVILTLTLVLWMYHRAALRIRGAAILDERTRLARDIHDSLLQGFGGIALQLHAVDQRLDSQSPERASLDRILTVVDRTLTDARKVVWDIRLPTEADDLAASIHLSAHRILADTGTAVNVVCAPGATYELPTDVRSQCRAIVEEILVNVRKHAHASTVIVQFEYTWSSLRITVRDDGRGFDAAMVAKRLGHWGLQGIRERAKCIGACVALDSQPGAGTEVRLRVPRWRWMRWIPALTTRARRLRARIAKISQ